MDRSVREYVKKSLPSWIEPIARTGYVAFRHAILRRFRIALGPEHARDRHLRGELQFWDHWLSTDKARVDERLNPTLDREVVLKCLATLPGEAVSIIDVGAGPLTTLGTEVPGKKVSLTAVDELGEQYRRLLERHSISPVVWTEPCSGEELSKHYGEESFDIAYAENALDHTVDPLRVIQNMVSIVKPGGYVILNHHVNEGDQEDYGHLHQWNFEERGGRCVLWRGRERHDLAEVFADNCKIESYTSDGSVKCIIKRLGTDREASSADALS